MKNLKNKVFSGLIWSSLDTFFLKGLTFVVMIYIARIIGPQEFGFIGMISVFLGVGITLFDGGMAASLIRSDNLDDYDYAFLGAWNFKSVIANKESEFVKNGGQFITHVPKIMMFS